MRTPPPQKPLVNKHRLLNKHHLVNKHQLVNNLQSGTQFFRMLLFTRQHRLLHPNVSVMYWFPNIPLMYRFPNVRGNLLPGWSFALELHRETDGQTAHGCTDSFSKGSLLFTVTRIPQFKSANLPTINYCQSRILILREAPQFPTKPPFGCSGHCFRSVGAGLQ